MMGFLKNVGKTKDFHKEKCWEVKVDMVSNCDKSPDSIDVLINPLAKTKIEKMMIMFEGIEWLAYLLGKDNMIDDIFVPKQQVTSGSVNDIDTSRLNSLPVIGVIHSHHSMGNGFSGTDNEWINQNNDISLCISNKGINGHVRWKTPCGLMKNIKVNIKLNIEVDYDVEKFELMVKKNIKRNTIFPGNNYKYYGYGSNRYKKEIEDENKIGIDDYLKSLLNDDDKEVKTVGDEIEYLRDSGMFVDLDEDEKNMFTC